MPIERVMMTADTVGGVWTYALELARDLSRRGVNVLLATLGDTPRADQRLQMQAVPRLEWRHGDFPLEWMHGALDAQPAAGQWLLSLTRTWQPDVVHLNHYGHGHLAWSAPALVVAHSCVCSWHESVHGRPAGSEWDGYRTHVARGLRAAPLVIAPSAAMLAQTERLHGPLRSSRVIRNGRRPQDFPAAAKRPVVLCAGRLWDEAKNVRALAQVAPDLPWPVCIAGETRHPQGGQAELRGVELPGRLTPEAMAQAYAHAAIYALPARYEPFGLSVLEAAMAGCALVLGNIPSLRELWQGAAVFVDPDNPPQLRDALRRLIEHPRLRQAWAQRARECAARYTTARMSAHYLDTYNELAPKEAIACMS